jgi:hypothetical protein
MFVFVRDSSLVYRRRRGSGRAASNAPPRESGDPVWIPACAGMSGDPVTGSAMKQSRVAPRGWIASLSLAMTARALRFDFLAVLIDLAAALRARPTAPHHLARRCGFAKDRQRRGAARTVAARTRTDAPAALCFRLLPDKGPDGAEDDDQKYRDFHGPTLPTPLRGRQ